MSASYNLPCTLLTWQKGSTNKNPYNNFQLKLSPQAFKKVFHLLSPNP